MVSISKPPNARRQPKNKSGISAAAKTLPAQSGDTRKFISTFMQVSAEFRMTGALIAKFDEYFSLETDISSIHFRLIYPIRIILKRQPGGQKQTNDKGNHG